MNISHGHKLVRFSYLKLSLLRCFFVVLNDVIDLEIWRRRIKARIAKVKMLINVHRNSQTFELERCRAIINMQYYLVQPS